MQAFILRLCALAFSFEFWGNAKSLASTPPFPKDEKAGKFLAILHDAGECYMSQPALQALVETGYSVTVWIFFTSYLGVASLGLMTKYIRKISTRHVYVAQYSC